MAWPMFGETLQALSVLGMGLTAYGVYLVVRGPVSSG